MNDEKSKEVGPTRPIRPVLPWIVGGSLLAGVLALYILYHRRNWYLMGKVIDMLRPWWYAFRIALRDAFGG